MAVPLGGADADRGRTVVLALPEGRGAAPRPPAPFDPAAVSAFGEAADVAAWSFSPDTDSVWLSRRMQQLFGYPPDAAPMPLRRFLSFVHPSDRDGVDAAIRGAAASGHPLRHEFRFVHAGGSVRPMRLDAAPLAARGGGGGRVLGVGRVVGAAAPPATVLGGLAVRDPTVDLAVRLRRLRDHLLRGIADELAIPLSPIFLQLELLRMSLVMPTDGQRKTLAMLRRNVDQIRSLVDHFREITELEAGVLRVWPNPFDLQAVVASVADSLAEEASATNATVASAPGPVLVVQADQTKITEVLFHLTRQVLRRAPAGAEVALSVARRDSVVVVRIASPRGGLTVEELETLLATGELLMGEPRGPPKGLSLGVFPCRSIVEHHRGELWWEPSPDGHHIQICFSLPIEGPSGL